MATFADIASVLFPHARFVDLRGWGESTILHNFDEYLDIAQQHPIKIKLITNATVNRPELWRRLGRDGVITGVSFDAAETGLFRVLRGGARMDQIVANIERLVEACREAGRDPGEQVYLCITASGSNIDQIDRVIELGMSLGLRRFKIEPLWAPSGAPDLLEHHAERVRRCTEKLAALARATGCLVEYSASLLSELTDPKATRKVCIHPWEYCYINARGRIGFCDHLNGREEFAWGEWGRQSFLEFWNGEQMRRLRSEHVRRLSGEAIQSCGDCNWCYDRRYMDLEDWIDPSWAQYRVTA
nr:SPASM domain-containing protein [Sorangium cellulosum]